MMPNFRVAVEVRAYPMPNKVGANLEAVLLGYLAWKESKNQILYRGKKLFDKTLNQIKNQTFQLNTFQLSH